MLLRTATLLAFVGATGHDAAGAEAHEHGVRDTDKHTPVARTDGRQGHRRAHVHAHSSEGQFVAGWS